MATTRIIPMHQNKGKTIRQCLSYRLDYGKNPDKTQEGQLISAYACDPETADAEFALSKREYFQLTGRRQDSDVIAYQVRQSFRPGEITPEEANRIGYEFAERFLKGNHAFIVCTHTVLDINYWKEKGKRIIDGRLASYLGVDCFYMPRTSYSGDVPVISFPSIHVCSNLKCGRLFDVRDNFDLDRYLRFGVNCPDCHKPAYPSRFITICENGHMDDFPWNWWVHRGNTNCKGMLKMYSTGNTSTLADMWVECELCGAKRSMSGATQEDNFSELHCSGHHPFRPRARNERCDKKVIPSQRGASNVYFSVSRSAISIPPWVNPLYNLIDEHLHDIELLRDVMGDDGVTAAYKKYFAEKYSRAEFDEALARRLSNITEFKEIKQMEYDANHHRGHSLFKLISGGRFRNRVQR